MNYTNQSFLNAVIERAKDPRRAVLDDYPIGDAQCAYRSPINDLKCFVGVCIPDGQYNENMEDKPVSHLDVPALADVSTGLMTDCQKVHDNNDPEEWAAALARIAANWGLRVKI